MNGVARIELLPNERILWEGKSSRAVRFGWMDVPITLFMLFWAGIPTVAIFSGTQDGGFQFFSLPFLLIGAYTLVGRFYVDLWLRSHSSYVLTNRRALILKNGGESGIRSIKLAPFRRCG